MDWETSFDEYLEHLCNAIGHSDRRAGLMGYCRGLMLPIVRKSVEPPAAHLEPHRVMCAAPVSASLHIKV